MSFKQHPEETNVAEYPSGTPSPLHLDSEGNLLVSSSTFPAPPTPPTSPSGSILITSPDLSYLLSELIHEVRKSNMYLALLVGEEIQDSDVEE